MDPLSVTASALAVVSAGESLIRLISKAKECSRAPAEIDAILTEVASLGMVLRTFDRSHLRSRPESLIAVSEQLEQCNLVITEVEALIDGIFCSDKSIPILPLHSHLFRVRWMRERKRMDALTQRLGRAKATLSLQLLITSLYVL